MQHRKAGKKLGRTVSHRRALFRNLVRALIISEKIVTTETKAKTIRPIIEKLVTMARKNDLHHRRLASIWVPDKALLKKLVETIAPRYATQPGGYMRITKLGYRAGDAAPMAQIEFIGAETQAETKTDKAKEEKKK